MKTQSILLAALASAPVALAHTAFTNFFVDGMPVGDGVAVRMSHNNERTTAPIGSLDSDDMACNVGGTKGVSRVQSVPDGALMTFEIRAWPNDPERLRLERNHKGPCALYLKKVNSAIEDRGAGDGWFKVFEHGYDSSTERWCSDEIIDNNGLLSVKLPEGLEGGAYLARPEILALHAAADGDPQFYTGCAQIHLESTGNLVPEETVSIPGYVKLGEPSTSFNMYSTDGSKYEMPGPKVARLTASGTASAKSADMAQTEGLKPAGCLAENSNWCGKEVSDYTTEKGCWASAQECWDQAETCFDEALPTGSAGCKLWQTKCQAINDECTAMIFTGPPNKNKVLTPVKKVIDVGLILKGSMATVDGSAPAAKPKPAASKPAEKPAAKPSTALVEEKPTAKPAAPKPAPANAVAAPAAPAATGASDVDESSNSESEADSDFAAPVPAPAPTPAPTPTAAPVACPEGWACVTVTNIAVVTQTVTVTADYNEMSRRGSRVGEARRRRYA